MSQQPHAPVFSLNAGRSREKDAPSSVECAIQTLRPRSPFGTPFLHPCQPTYTLPAEGPRHEIPLGFELSVLA